MASFLSTLFGGGAEREAAERNRALLSQYQTQGTGFLDNGLSQSTGALSDARTAANAAYDPLSSLGNKYGAASSLYLDALGANGADAARAAQSSFTTSPGYQQGIDAGLDAINRRRAAAGMLGSGNADLDALTFAQNNQNQQYNGWLDRLGGFVSPELSATSGAASGRAGIETGIGGSLAGLYSQDAQNRVNLAGSTTSGGISANNQQAQGEAAGARNLLNAGMSLASLAAGGGFGFGGGGGALSAGGYGGGLGGSTYSIGYGGRNVPVYA